MTVGGERVKWSIWLPDSMLFYIVGTKQQGTRSVSPMLSPTFLTWFWLVFILRSRRFWSRLLPRGDGPPFRVGFVPVSVRLGEFGFLLSTRVIGLGLPRLGLPLRPSAPFVFILLFVLGDAGLAARYNVYRYEIIACRIIMNLSPLHWVPSPLRVHLL